MAHIPLYFLSFYVVIKHTAEGKGKETIKSLREILGTQLPVIIKSMD